MKKIFLAAAFLFTLAVSSFGKGIDNGTDTRLLKDLTVAFKNSPGVQWSDIDNYVKAAFTFNGKEAYAFYTADKVELIGFCVLVDKEDLNLLTVNSIKQKYPDWLIVEAIMIVDSKGFSDFF